jgi:hypothetical protein
MNSARRQPIILQHLAFPCIRLSSDSTLGTEFGYPDQSFPWFYSVHSGKCFVSIWNDVRQIPSTPFQSFFHNHYTTIRCRCNAVNNVPSNKPKIYLIRTYVSQDSIQKHMYVFWRPHGGLERIQTQRRVVKATSPTLLLSVLSKHQAVTEHNPDRISRRFHKSSLKNFESECS